MKRSVRILTAFLAFCLAFCLGAADCRAAQTDQEPYTYTLTLRMGKNGTIKSDAEAQIRSMSGGGMGSAVVTVDQAGGVITVSGLGYGDRVVFQAQALAEVPENGKYYAKGVRQSGHDDSSGIASCEVTGDRDYVVAYGVRGDMVSYVVNYQDTEGNTLAESNTYYGNVGDRPVVAFRYIEGYEPQAYNLTKTLTENAADNVFTFVYKKIPEGGGTQGGTTGGGQDSTGGQTGGGTQQQPGGQIGEGDGTFGPGGAATPAPDAPAPAGPASPAGPAAPAGPDDGPGGPGAPDDGPGTPDDADDGPVEVPDDEVPLDEGPQEIVDLDDDEVPLADFPVSKETAHGRRMGAVAIAAGLVGAAALIGVFIWLWMQKKKKEEKA